MLSLDAMDDVWMPPDRIPGVHVPHLHPPAEPYNPLHSTPSHATRCTLVPHPSLLPCTFLKPASNRWTECLGTNRVCARLTGILPRSSGPCQRCEISSVSPPAAAPPSATPQNCAQADQPADGSPRRAAGRWAGTWVDVRAGRVGARARAEAAPHLVRRHVVLERAEHHVGRGFGQHRNHLSRTGIRRVKPTVCAIPATNPQLTADGPSWCQLGSNSQRNTDGPRPRATPDSRTLAVRGSPQGTRWASARKQPRAPRRMREAGWLHSAAPQGGTSRPPSPGPCGDRASQPWNDRKKLPAVAVRRPTYLRKASRAFGGRLLRGPGVRVRQEF